MNGHMFFHIGVIIFLNLVFFIVLAVLCCCCCLLALLLLIILLLCLLRRVPKEYEPVDTDVRVF
jgi:hypothetical protein